MIPMNTPSARITAIFRGPKESLGYVPGFCYTLITWTQHDRIYIRESTTDAARTSQSICGYTTIARFVENWDVLDPAPGRSST